MGQVHKLELPDADRLEAFNSFWQWYPHHPARKKKPAARQLFMKITSKEGHQTRTLDKDSGRYIELHLKATPEEIVEGAKEFWKSLPKKEGYTPDTTYCPAAEVWLNGGRWED